MFLSIHAGPVTVIGVMIAILLVLFWLFNLKVRYAPQTVDSAKRSFGTLALVNILACGGLAYMGEQSLDELDIILAAHLPQAGIMVVEIQGWGTIAIVSKTGCTASYRIQSSELLDEPGVWPLVAGTGKAIAGCSNDELDVRFIPMR